MAERRIIRKEVKCGGELLVLNVHKKMCKQCGRENRRINSIFCCDSCKRRYRYER
jgi:hypothetical protein